MEKYDTNLLTAAAIGKPNFVVKQIGSVLLLLGMLYHIFEVGFWFQVLYILGKSSESRRIH